LREVVIDLAKLRDYALNPEHPRVRTGWILLAGERYPGLTTCFIKD